MCVEENWNKKVEYVFEEQQRYPSLYFIWRIGSLKCIVKPSIVVRRGDKICLFCSKYHNPDGGPTVASLNLDDTCSENSTVENLQLNKGKVSLNKLLNKFEGERKRWYRCLGKNKDTAIPESIYSDKLEIIEGSDFKENFENY